MSDPSPKDRPNRRGSRRLAPKGKIKVICRNALDLGPNMATALLDLSETGARLKLSKGLKQNDEVTITVQSTVLMKSASRRGKVAWCFPIGDSEFDVGVNFDKPLPYAEFSTLVKI